ncbi:hypothetical protein C0Q70_15369 [Pomacea canaliculata]|uniref:GRF-type domain-containing protein n=1 Tax=Pomacea canaliculata TaxID=400727 RepID=A0A2T7NUM4_POMCA|nr:hypothetical protein C0Q70_15369 [Pomacea canaliculata]
MLDEPTAIVDGYSAYFSFSRKRTGYSGTANFCKDAATPFRAEEGLSDVLSRHLEDTVGSYGNHGEFETEELHRLDGEGRAVITQHEVELLDGSVKKLTLINVYVPRAAEREDRWLFKLRFLALLQSRAEALLRNGSHVIVLGDINTTHKRIDHCDPTTQEFLRADSRQWINQFLRQADRDSELPPLENKMTFKAVTTEVDGGHFVDAFRFFHPDQTEAYTNWSTTTSARQTNYGDLQLEKNFKYTDSNADVSSQSPGLLLSSVVSSQSSGKRSEVLTKKRNFGKGNLKRSNDSSSPSFSGKKNKGNDNDPTLGSRTATHKQASLFNFFCKPASSSQSKLSKRIYSNEQVTGQDNEKEKQADKLESLQSSELDAQDNPTSSANFSDSGASLISQESANMSSDAQPKYAPELGFETESSALNNSTPGSHTTPSEDKSRSVGNLWRGLLTGPPKPPLCKGHQEPCVLRTVKKLGPNKGKQFYVCARPEGHSYNKEARCDYFQWITPAGKKAKLM